MARKRPIPHTLGRIAAHTPGLKRLPVMRLLAVADVAMLTREHFGRLTPEERRRAVELLRIGRGRPSRLSDAERAELTGLVAKMDPRGLAGEAADAISPIPIPGRVKYGRRRGPGNDRTG